MKMRHILKACVLAAIVSQMQSGWAQEKAEKKIIVGAPSTQDTDARQRAPRTGSTGAVQGGGGAIQRSSSGAIEVDVKSGGGRIEKTDPFATGRGGMPMQPPQSVPTLSPAAIEQIPSTPQSSGIIPVPPGGLPQIPFIPLDPGTLPPSPFFPPDPGTPGP